MASILCIAATGKVFEEDYYRGKHYTKGKYMSRFLYVSFLKEGYTLEKRPKFDPHNLEMVSFGYEMTSDCYLVKDKQLVKKITLLNDLEGFANVNSVEKAIEFVRFRTSPSTYFLFRPDVMNEVVKRKNKWRFFGACSPEFFEKHKLKRLELETKKGYFVITRYVIRYPWKETEIPQTLYRIIERVFENGKYEVEETKIVEGFTHKEIAHPLSFLP